MRKEQFNFSSIQPHFDKLVTHGSCNMAAIAAMLRLFSLVYNEEVEKSEAKKFVPIDFSSGRTNKYMYAASFGTHSHSDI